MAESLAFGTQVSVNASNIGNLVALKWNGITIDTIETTHHGLANKFRTLRKTLAKGEPLTFTIQMTPANLTQIMPHVDPDSAVQAWVITYPFDGGDALVQISGHLTKFEFGDADPDGLIIGEVEVTPTGEVVVIEPP
jgi:hypothetical protein